ncbi:hypothetical protein H9P43_007293 [Blastocladiella emersonii ATCC 22665]|nr:hypothetical protein H9P43_007293 [Blastocladiella emersonii ATCC 22665]
MTRTECKSSETRLVGALSAYETLLDAHAVAAKTLQSGFFNLSQARHAMGPVLGPIAYDYRMKASVSITGESQHLGLAPVPVAVVEKDEPAEEDEDATKPPAPTDPIKWFGAFPNQSLRSAQSDFKNAVDALVTLANHKAKLVAALKEFESR